GDSGHLICYYLIFKNAHFGERFLVISYTGLTVISFTLTYSGCVMAYITAFAISATSNFLRSSGPLPSLKGVSTIPGEIFVTRTPVLASSFSSPIEIVRIACFVAL